MHASTRKHTGKDAAGTWHAHAAAQAQRCMPMQTYMCPWPKIDQKLVNTSYQKKSIFWLKTKSRASLNDITT